MKRGGRSKPAKRRSSKPRKGPEATNEPTTGGGFLEQFRTVIGAEDIIAAGRSLGVIQRQRKVDLPKLVEATVLSMWGTPGMQTSAMTNYLSLTGVELAPSSFYDRFSEPYAKLMKHVAKRALEHVRQAGVNSELVRDIGVLLDDFDDIRVADSTSHMLKSLAKSWAPATTKKRPAGVKFHAVISLKDDLPIADEITPQRTHDNKAFPEATMEPGTLTLFDLGYIDVERFIDAIHRGAHFLTRLKKTHDPEIARVHHGKGSRLKARGMRLSEALESEVLVPNNGVVDLDVRLQTGKKEAIARVVAIFDTETTELHWYLTSVGRDVLDPFDVGEAYRLRWVVELVFKQLKSGTGLDAILAWRPSAVSALIYAKVVALCLVRLLEAATRANGDSELLGRLALVLVLSRAVPLLIAYSLQREGVTIEEMERRIMLIASTMARSRNRRRERERRKREASIGRPA